MTFFVMHYRQAERDDGRDRLRAEFEACYTNMGVGGVSVKLLQLQQHEGLETFVVMANKNR